MKRSFWACLLLAAVGCRARPAPKEIAVGVISPLTGPNAAYGVPMRNGIDLRFQEANARSPGLIRAIHADDMSRPEEAEKLAQRLITEERVEALLGESSSLATQKMAAIAERAEVPMVAPSATEPGITEGGEHVFRACFVDPFQAEAMARFARAGLKLRRVAVARDLGSSYSQRLADAFVEAWKKEGGEIAADEGYQMEEPNDAAALDRIARAQAEAVYLPGYVDGIARIARELETRRLGVKLLGADGFDSEALIRTASVALEGSHFTTQFAPDAPDPVVRQFVEAYRKDYNETPDATAALGYDAAGILVEAASRDRAHLVEVLAGTKGFKGVTGEITFDGRHAVKKPAVILKIERRKRVFVGTVPWPSG